MKSFFEFWERLREAYANRHEPERAYVLASAYWRILLCIAAFIIFLSVCYGLWKIVSLVDVFGEEAQVLTPGRGALTPRLEALDATIAGFEDRQAEYESKKGIVPQIADPSR